MIKNKQKCEDGRSNIIESDYQTITTIWPLKAFYRSLANLFQKFSKLNCLYLTSDLLFDTSNFVFDFFGLAG